MRITDIDIDKILCISMFSSAASADEEEEEGGFLKKLFSKKHKKEENFYEDKVREIGVEKLREELAGDVYAYRMEGVFDAPCLVLTDNYLIIEGEDILPLDDVQEFGLHNLASFDPCLFQFATDRIGIPYDPSFVSEYEGEESFELSRFKVKLQIKDDYGQIFEYDVPMDIEDRKAFCKVMCDSWDVEDSSDQDCLEGTFDDRELINAEDYVTEDVGDGIGYLLGISPVVPEEYSGEDEGSQDQDE